MTATAARPTWIRWLRRALIVTTLMLAPSWGLLEWIRHRAEHRAIPVFVMLRLPPAGPMAAAMKAAGLTNTLTPVPYAQVTNLPVSLRDIAAIKRCLARDRFLPLFPLEIRIEDGEVTGLYGMKVNRRTNRLREAAVILDRSEGSWRIVRIVQHWGTVTTARPLTRWEKFLSYLPFTD